MYPVVGFVDQYLKSQNPSLFDQQMALVELEAKMAACVRDPQEKVYDEEFALAEKSVEVKQGKRVLIHYEPYREMTEHFTLGKKAVAIAKKLGVDIDSDNRVATLRWVTERSFAPNEPGTVKQLDSIMVDAVKSLMQKLLQQPPSAATWQELKQALYTALDMPLCVFETPWPYPNHDRVFSVYDNDLPRWLVALALAAVTKETDLYALFPDAQKALNETKSIQPEVHNLLTTRTIQLNEQALGMLAMFVQEVVKPHLDTADILLKTFRI